MNMTSTSLVCGCCHHILWCGQGLLDAFIDKANTFCLSSRLWAAHVVRQAGCVAFVTSL
jgi:hypothetical protein